ncbi:hypothetical protein JCM6882_006829, partial [Rhodosporidiobolus microsporus]
LSPTPLLLPLACARLGPALFVPLLVLAGALGWLSAVVIGAEGRYVGARSFPALASAVFPHRLKLHLLGESLAVLFVLGGSVVRAALDVVAAAEVAVDLLVPEHRRRDWEREVGVGVVCAVWESETDRVELDLQLLVPLLLPPLLRALSLDRFLSPPSSSSSSPPARYSRLASTSSPDLSSTPSTYQTSSGPATAPRARWTALLRLPAYALALIAWPLALVILGVRLKRLNRDASAASSLSSLSLSSLALNSSASSLPLPRAAAVLPSHLFPNPTDPQTGATLWPAILLPFAALLGAAHETFFYFTSLARPSSTSTARVAARRGTSFSGEVPAGEGGLGAGGAGGAGKRDEGKRNQYPLAIAVGLFGSFLIHLGWALVGALGPSSALSPSPSDPPGEPVPTLPTPNFLSDPRLPRSDFFLNLARLLVLVGILSQLQSHARFGIGRARRAVAFLVPPKGQGGAGGRAGVRGWRDLVARVGVWAAVAGLGVLVVSIPKLGGGVGGGGGENGGGEGEGGGAGEGEVGGHGSGLVYAVQWWAVVGGGLGACLGPALAYLTLFHLRPPRTIFTSSPSSPSFTSDALLVRKERAIQRKLSGRRVWSDVGVFGALGPVGVVLVGRGVWALERSGERAMRLPSPPPSLSSPSLPPATLLPLALVTTTAFSNLLLHRLSLFSTYLLSSLQLLSFLLLALVCWVLTRRRRGGKGRRGRGRGMWTAGAAMAGAAAGRGWAARGNRSWVWTGVEAILVPLVFSLLPSAPRDASSSGPLKRRESEYSPVPAASDDPEFELEPAPPAPSSPSSLSSAFSSSLSRTPSPSPPTSSLPPPSLVPLVLPALTGLLLCFTDLASLRGVGAAVLAAGAEGAKWLTLREVVQGEEDEGSEAGWGGKVELLGGIAWRAAALHLPLHALLRLFGLHDPSYTRTFPLDAVSFVLWVGMLAGAQAALFFFLASPPASGSSSSGAGGEGEECAASPTALLAAKNALLLLLTEVVGPEMESTRGVRGALFLVYAGGAGFEWWTQQRRQEEGREARWWEDAPRPRLDPSRDRRHRLALVCASLAPLLIFLLTVLIPPCSLPLPLPFVPSRCPTIDLLISHYTYPLPFSRRTSLTCGRSFPSPRAGWR